MISSEESGASEKEHWISELLVPSLDKMGSKWTRFYESLESENLLIIKTSTESTACLSPWYPGLLDSSAVKYNNDLD